MNRLQRLRRSDRALRVFSATGAGAYGQVVTVVSQLVSVPILLSRWDLATYGYWILLSAVPQYVTLVDLGIVTATGSEMTIARARGVVQRAQELFDAAQAFVAIAIVAVAALLYVAIWLTPVLEVFPNPMDARVGLSFLSVSVLVSQANALSESVARSAGRQSTALYISAHCRLAEWIGSIAGFLLFGSFAAVGGGALLARTIAAVVAITFAAKSDASLRWRLRLKDAAKARHLLGPSFSLLAYNVSSALVIQGTSVLAGTVLGPTQLGILNIYRTVSRTAVQATGLLSMATWAEISSIWGRGDVGGLRTLYRRTAALSGVFGLLCGLLMFGTFPVVLDLWTRGRVPFDVTIAALFCTYAVTASWWHAPRVLLMATNLHTSLGWLLLVTAAAGLVVIYWSTHTFGLTGTAVSLLIIESCSALVAFASVRRKFRA